jgi:hypothetical protein
MATMPVVEKLVALTRVSDELIAVMVAERVDVALLAASTSSTTVSNDPG